MLRRRFFPVREQRQIIPHIQFRGKHGGMGVDRGDGEIGDEQLVGFFQQRPGEGENVERDGGGGLRRADRGDMRALTRKSGTLRRAASQTWFGQISDSIKMMKSGLTRS